MKNWGKQGSFKPSTKIRGLKVFKLFSMLKYSNVYDMLIVILFMIMMRSSPLKKHYTFLLTLIIFMVR